MTAPPPVQYVKTSDAVTIAFTTAGSGPPLVWVQPPFSSHVQLDWEQPILRGGFEGIVAAGMTLVRFDPRGSGLSQRDVSDISPVARARDLEAVIGRLGFDRFAVIAIEFGAIPAIEYAAMHPDQISRLILMNPASRWTDLIAETQRGQSLRAMVDDWEMFTENLPRVSFGFGYKDAGRYAAFIRASIGHDMYMRILSEPIDALSSAGRVEAPTLVIRHTGLEWLSMQSTRDLVTAMVNARMVAIEGDYTDHPGQTTRAILGFLAGYTPILSAPTAIDRQAGAVGSSGTAIILFADIADSTALTERLGDAAFRTKARDLDGALRTVIRGHAGTPIEGKLLGDGVLAVFTSARQAIEAALACAKAGGEVSLPLHLGLHAGDVIREDNNVYGGAVNIASRISGLSAPGEVLVSDIVRGLARTSAGVQFEDRGEHSLKGVGDPVRVWTAR
jgi:class 3 adenylate cyclase/pimeloyl-ACP methyl ester carboxylesterase